MNLPPYKLIRSASDWQVCWAKLRAESRLAIDLEANSMFAYREQVCLIQISTADQDFIIDPLAPFDLSRLGELIADPQVEKVFHAAEYDLMLLKREYDWEICNLFDTMWAARILGYPRYGLANLLQEFYQVKLNKRYQKSNWCKRPLSTAQLAYAQLDTHYLLSLRDHLAAELQESGRMPEAAVIFEEQTRVKLNNNEFDADSFWAITGAYDLRPTQQAILKELSIYRNQQAYRRNQPLFKIFNDKTLFELARAAPSRLEQLPQVHGMTSGQIRRYGKQLLEVIKRGREMPPPSTPKRNKRPPEPILNRYDRLHNWRKTRAQTRGVESDVIISRDALWLIATQNPQTRDELANIDLVGQWRCQTYGDEILAVLHNNNR